MIDKPLATPPTLTVPWPERLLSITLDTQWGEVDVHNVYVPANYQQGNVHLPMRIATLEGLYTGLAHISKRHRILCGDFNLPRKETTEGKVVTFGQHDTSFVWSERADAAERSVLLGLAVHDLHDVFRQLHGYEKREFSWYTTTKDHTGYRLDHVFASSSLRAIECRYLHQFRESWDVRPWRGEARSLRACVQRQKRG